MKIYLISFYVVSLSLFFPVRIISFICAHPNGSKSEREISKRMDGEKRNFAFFPFSFLTLRSRQRRKIKCRLSPRFIIYYNEDGFYAGKILIWNCLAARDGGGGGFNMVTDGIADFWRRSQGDLGEFWWCETRWGLEFPVKLDVILNWWFVRV